MATNITVITGSGTSTYTVNVDRRGPVGPAGEGTNAITSATTSDGTAALYLDSLRFETTNGGPTQTGQMAWESTDGSIDAMLESGVVVAMGEDLLIRVRNATASPIAKGAALAYDGTQGASGRLEVKPWVGSNISTAKLFLGFAAAAIPANSNGYAQWFGKLDGINTSGGGENWQDEQLIYAVPGTSSTITNVAPTSGEYGAVAVVVNAGSGTSGILYVRPTFESIPVITSADITDATSDGQSNPGKVLKTDSNGALQIEFLTLGNDAPGTAGVLSIVGTNNTAAIENNDDTTAVLKFGSTSGAIMVGAANLSEISSASTALTNLGVTGTGVQSALAAATNATGGLVTFGGNIGAATGTSLTLKHPTNTRTATHSWSGTTAYTIQVGAGALITLYHQDAGAQNIIFTPFSTGRVQCANGFTTTGTIDTGNLIASGYLEGAEMTAPAVPAANGYRIFAEDNGSGKTRLMVQFATGAAQQIAIEP